MRAPDGAAAMLRRDRERGRRDGPFETCCACRAPLPTPYSESHGRDVCSARCWRALLEAQRSELG